MKKPWNIWKWITAILFVLYMLLLCKFILFKKPLSSVYNHFTKHYNLKAVKDNLHQSNVTPFTTIRLYWNSHMRAEYRISNLIGNLVGFVPLGIFLPLLFKRCRNWKTILLIFLISLLFETIQLVGVLGSFDVDDLLLNTLGGAIGYGLFAVLFKAPAPDSDLNLKAI